MNTEFIFAALFCRAKDTFAIVCIVNCVTVIVRILQIAGIRSAKSVLSYSNFMGIVR